MAATATQPDLATVEWWTAAELADRWRTSVDTINRRCKAKEIQAMKVGSQFRIHQSTIETHENTAKPKPSPVRKKNFINLPNLSGL